MTRNGVREVYRDRGGSTVAIIANDGTIQTFEATREVTICIDERGQANYYHGNQNISPGYPTHEMVMEVSGMVQAPHRNPMSEINDMVEELDAFLSDVQDEDISDETRGMAEQIRLRLKARPKERLLDPRPMSRYDDRWDAMTYRNQIAILPEPCPPLAQPGKFLGGIKAGVVCAQRLNPDGSVLKQVDDAVANGVVSVAP